MPKAHQKGRTLIIVMVVIVGGMALSIFLNEKDRSDRRTTAAQEAAAQQAQKVKQAQVELEALRKQQESARNADLLQRALSETDSTVSRWEDTVRLADNTSRINLATPVSQLQAIRRDTSALQVPPCLSDGKASLLMAMDLTIDAYLAFMADTAKVGKYIASSKIDEAAPHMQKFKSARLACPVIKG